MPPETKILFPFGVRWLATALEGGSLLPPRKGDWAEASLGAGKREQAPALHMGSDIREKPDIFLCGLGVFVVKNPDQPYLDFGQRPIYSLIPQRNNVEWRSARGLL